MIRRHPKRSRPSGTDAISQQESSGSILREKMMIMLMKDG